MRYTRQTRFAKKGVHASHPLPPPTAKQPYEAFLVLDVEATCQQGTDFNFPNEIIEFPVCLMRWKDRTDDHKASQLEVVEEFRSFVKPTWQPTLSQFCTDLTGITQEQVDCAPLFPAVLASFQKFMIKHGLIDEGTGDRLIRFCWCSDGPFDIRDFVVKQCFISKVPMPGWIQGDVLDVRTSVLDWLHSREPPKNTPAAKVWDGPRRRTLNISAQLKALGLPSFEGRQHSGIDDSRNIAKIVAELARRGISLHPNTAIQPNRRWNWMGKHGQILDGYWTVNNVEAWKLQ
ncbi:ribonuclease H-like domain-containing protein [Lyophyllum atratum]|nr:ribonuclease H-like domain-containing protein [Lyophyllum atratum]